MVAARPECYEHSFPNPQLLPTFLTNTPIRDNCGNEMNKKRTIKWRDANSYAGWWEIDDIKPLNATTTGYVVKENKEYIVIASTISENGLVNGAISIPKKWIIN